MHPAKHDTLTSAGIQGCIRPLATDGRPAVKELSFQSEKLCYLGMVKQSVGNVVVEM